MSIYVTSRSVWYRTFPRNDRALAAGMAQQRQSSGQSQSTVPETEKEKKEKKAKENQKLEKVIVTGTNIRPDVSEVAALPLTVLSADDIAKQGPQEIAETLRENPRSREAP